MTAHTFQQRVNQKFVNSNLTIDFIEQYFNEKNLIELLNLNYSKFKNRKNGDILFEYILSKAEDNAILYDNFISDSYYKFRLPHSFSIINSNTFLNLLKKYEFYDFIAEYSIISMDIDLFKKYYSDDALIYTFENIDLLNYIKDKKSFIKFFNKIYSYLENNSSVTEFEYIEDTLIKFFNSVFIKYIDEYDIFEAIKDNKSFTYFIFKEYSDIMLNEFKFIKKDQTIQKKIYLLNLFASDIKILGKNSIDKFLNLLEGFKYIKSLIDNLDSDKDKFTLITLLKNSEYIKLLNRYKKKAQKDYVNMKESINKLEMVVKNNNFDIDIL